MSAANPYTPPRANVADIETDTFQSIRMWSASGRIGRLRYWTYTIIASVLCGLLVGLGVALLGPSMSAVIVLVLYVPLLVFIALLAIQRAHDMDWSGWMSLLLIIPFIGLIWLFKSGSDGENRFGAPPPPNSLWVKILGLGIPVLYLLIIFAVAIPAYQGYVERARAAQQSQ